MALVHRKTILPCPRIFLPVYSIYIYPTQPVAPFNTLLSYSSMKQSIECQTVSKKCHYYEFAYLLEKQYQNFFYFASEYSLPDFPAWFCCTNFKNRFKSLKYSSLKMKHVDFELIILGQGHFYFGREGPPEELETAMSGSFWKGEMGREAGVIFWPCPVWVH